MNRRRSVGASSAIDAVERYRSIFHVEHDAVDAVVAAVFTPDARFESTMLPEPLVGLREIASRMHAIRATLEGVPVRHVTEVEWSHRTARWCWAASDASGTRRGMDVARFTADGTRIELLVVFTGLLPKVS